MIVRSSVHKLNTFFHRKSSDMFAVCFVLASPQYGPFPSPVFHFAILTKHVDAENDENTSLSYVRLLLLIKRRVRDTHVHVSQTNSDQQ